MARLEYFDDLLTYWQVLSEAAGGAVPARQQFNPMEVPKLLPFMFMLERKAPEDLTVRLVGTALDGVSSNPATGTNLYDRYGEADRAFHEEMYGHIFGQPCGVRLERLVQLEADPVYFARSLMLPLANRAGEVCYCVGIARVRHHHGEVSQKDLHTFNTSYLNLGFGVPGKS